MSLATVILLLSCLEISCSSSNQFCLQLDQTRIWRIRCASRLQTCSVSTPAANMRKSYGFNPLWTMLTTMFQEKQNTYHISQPIIKRFFSKTCAISFTFEHFHWFSQLCNETLQHFARFWRLFRSVMWSILVPFFSLFSLFSLFAFLSWFFLNSG